MTHATRSLHDTTDLPSVLVPVDLPSRSALVENAIRLAILRGELQPGEQLVERRLAVRLNVSKTPVREALQRLSSSGLVAIDTPQKTFVAEVTEEKIRNVYQMRFLLQPEAVRMAAQRAPSEGVQEEAERALEDAADATKRGDLADLTIANRRFHRAMYAECGNKLLISTLDRLEDQVAFLSVWGWRRNSTWEVEAREHMDILEALRECDGERASTLVRAHIEKSAATLAASTIDVKAPEA